MKNESMTVKDLVRTIVSDIKSGKLSENDLVVLSADEEGNHFGGVMGYSIDRFDEREGSIHCDEDVERDPKLKKGTVRCLTLWP